MACSRGCLEGCARRCDALERTGWSRRESTSSSTVPDAVATALDDALRALDVVGLAALHELAQ